MVAIIANLARVYESLFARTFSSASRKLYNPDIPAPPNLHVVLDDRFLADFDSVLIVGDVHGCYDEMIEMLSVAQKKLAKADARILKLFVGDLVNKGPKSKQVIEYFMQQGKEDMLSVRGNHDERMVQEYMRFLKDKNVQLNPEHEWIKQLDAEHIDFLVSLPYTISLPKLNSIIGRNLSNVLNVFLSRTKTLNCFKLCSNSSHFANLITNRPFPPSNSVHAGLVPGKNVDQNNWLDMTKMRNVIYEDYYDGEGIRGTESDKIGDAWVDSHRGDLHIYFGHDAMRGLQSTEFATGLDTGCVYGKKLSAVLIDENLKRHFLTVKAKRQYCDPFNRPKKKK